MPLNKEQIKNAALDLDPLDREALADELLYSLSDDDREAIDAAWLAEAARRDKDFLSGKCRAKPVQQVIARLKKKSRS
jgi:hypothetical protein